eukprot:sb/3479175/
MITDKIRFWTWKILPGASKILIKTPNNLGKRKNKLKAKSEKLELFFINLKLKLGSLPTRKVRFKRLDLRFLEIGVLRVILTKRDPEFPGISGQVV